MSKRPRAMSQSHNLVFYSGKQKKRVPYCFWRGDPEVSKGSQSHLAGILASLSSSRMPVQRINNNTRWIVFSGTTSSVLVGKNEVLGSLIITLLALLTCPWHDACGMQTVMENVLFTTMNVSLSTQTWKLWGRRAQDLAANSRLLFLVITQHLGLLSGDWQAALEWMLIWWEQTRCYQVPFRTSLSNIFLLFWWPEKVGQKAGPGWATGAKLRPTGTVTLCQPHCPSPLGFPFPITGCNVGPTLWFQVQLGRKLPAWLEHIVGLYLPTAQTW